MSFIRGVFIFAFVMLIAGAVGARMLVGSIFSQARESPYLASGIAATETPTRVPRPSALAVRPVKRAVTRPATVRRIRYVSRPKTRATPTPAATATPLASPTISPTPVGIVTLSRYWVASPTAHPGTTIAVGYVIDNETGHTARVELGASVKASQLLGWASGAVSDPAHDAIAIAPPGVSTHTRLFTLSGGLHGGSYDVAWGLRDANTGRRVALVSAGNALHVEAHPNKYVPAP